MDENLKLQGVNNEENAQIKQVKDELNGVRLSLSNVEKRLGEQTEQSNKIYHALMGSDISKDGGLVGRIQILEKENEDLREELDAVKTNAVKSDLYLKWIWGLVGAFGSGIFTYVLALIFKK